MRLGDSRFELANRAVHVWLIRTQASAATVARSWAVLEPDERRRASRFRTADLQHSFIVAHGALRTLAGRYLGRRPADVRFSLGRRGKPALAGNTKLMFNLSHSGAFMLAGFTLGCEIGIDIEQIRAVPDMQEVADRYFSTEEAAELLGVPRTQRETAFFHCWTRKEAYIKATGDGLSTPLGSFQVTLGPCEDARFVRLPEGVGSVQAWTLEDLKVEPGYAAALAYGEEQRPLKLLGALEAADLLAWVAYSRSRKSDRVADD
jgi:4'-phosphopantetheinyl transferase